MADKKSSDGGGKKTADDALWDFVTRDVKPLKKSQPRVAEEGAVKKAPPKPLAKNPQPALASKPAPLQPKAHPSAGLDTRTKKKLRKGEIAIEAQIDLHGMSQARAHTALQRFILEAHEDGKRCVLVITGKGGAQLRSPLDKGTGVLKRSVPLWLEEAPLAGVVLKAQIAQPRHGGEGALYVYLRRQR